MKKFLTRALFFLTMVALMMPAGFSISASSPDEMSISFGAVGADNTVTARVRFEHLNQPVVGDFYFGVNYDAAVLRYDSVRFNVPAFDAMFPVMHDAGNLTFAVAGPMTEPRPPVQSQTTVVEINFAVLNAAAFNDDSATLELYGEIGILTDAGMVLVPFDGFDVVEAPAAAPNALTRVDVENVSVGVGGTLPLSVAFAPAGADLTGATVVWSSSAANVTVPAAGDVAPGTTATVRGVTVTAANAPVVVTAQLQVGGALVAGATQTFNVTVTEAGELTVTVDSRTTWGSTEVTVELKNETGSAINNAYIVLSAGTELGGASFFVLEGISIADGATETFGTNLFVSTGARVSAWVLPSTPTSLGIANLQSSQIGMDGRTIN